jgi:hypothetical protein
MQKEPNKFWPNKDSCYVCGDRASMTRNLLVYKCQRHAFNSNVPPGMFKCCICKMTQSKMIKFNGLGFIDAKYCDFCNPNFCCMFDEIIE